MRGMIEITPYLVLELAVRLPCGRLLARLELLEGLEELEEELVALQHRARILFCASCCVDRLRIHSIQSIRLNWIGVGQSSDIGPLISIELNRPIGRPTES